LYFLRDGGVQAKKPSLRGVRFSWGTKQLLTWEKSLFSSQPVSKACIGFSYRAETSILHCLNVNTADFQPRGLSPEAREFIPAAQVGIMF